MKVSREELTTRAQERRIRVQRARTASRGVELVWLIAAAIVTIAGLTLVYSAKTHDAAAVEKSTLNLNEVSGAPQLIPVLSGLPDADQEFVANRIFEVSRRGERFSNVGALARLRITEAELAGMRPPASFAARLQEARQRREGREERQGWFARHFRGQPELSIPLLTAAQFRDVKPGLRVRDASQFRRTFLLWACVFLAGFVAVHAIWRWRGFGGDNLMLPILMTLAGIGMMLMISLRDPLRDTLMFTDFAQGVVGGCAALVLFSMPDYERHFSRLSYVPLAASVLLAIALGLFGSGPGTSDARVNLFFFQPADIIRMLLVFFLAGYFARNWDALRQLQQEVRGFSVPRLDYLLPVAAGVAVSIALFFWLSDLGPALVIGCLFLTMYSIARNRVLLAAAGLFTIMLGFVGGYVIGYPHTVTERVRMWKSPWDNDVHGGDQLADSLWALSTGGGSGTGLGLGDPETVPAAHTDLIISAFGEQAGFLGILALYGLYAVLLWRTLRTALNAAGAYSFFLVVGLALVIAYQLLLITGGLLGLIPLSGVVSPFLSYGRTSMVANFALFAIVLSVSARGGKRSQQENFGAGTRVLAMVLGAAVVVCLARFAWVQVVKENDIVARGSLVLQADGARRYEYNPRLVEIARSVPKGSIYDRAGVPLATSDWALLEQHRADYDKLGVNLAETTSKRDDRQYPFGGPMFYLLGDPRSRLKQGASNTAFQERASRIRLQGYDDVAELEESRDPETGRITARIRRDYRALIPLLRHRWEPDNPQVKAILARPRDIHMSIDAALQMRASQILKQHLTKLRLAKGAVVVLDPSNGDLLASVSYPWPEQTQLATLQSNAEAPLPDADLLDRARFGLYPPGSSFKIVTAIAALRKDPALARQRYECIRMPDGRVGNIVWHREIRDDVRDKEPHGDVDMERGIAVSCNAYFAQLGAESVGAAALYDAASRLGISVAQPNTAKQLQRFLPQASYGQGQVVVSPFQMARVAATIAGGGNAPQGRWIVDETNARVRSPEALLTPELAAEIGGFMRGVVTSGTGRVLKGGPIAIAGKTGTAELANAPSHAWFIGFAPYGVKAGARQIAFAVLVENGEYGGTAAAPIAGEIVAEARKLGII
jgi:cell division protein FtsW (lipid II flippase)